MIKYEFKVSKQPDTDGKSIYITSNERGIMSILGCPISTFLAYIVAILSILVSIVWALVKKFPFEG